MRNTKAAERAIKVYNLNCNGVITDPYELQLIANRIARKYGTNCATEIIINRSRNTRDMGGENTPQGSMFQMRIEISSDGKTLTTSVLNV